MSLDDYHKKRNFSKTPEPSALRGGKHGARFVVQRHDASSLHYDLRLEYDGVLKSWAVPKGPSMNPADKRLAVRTEDHPVKYLEFEGTIPKGNYGAGEMQIWDRGTYELQEGNSPWEEGNLKIRFHGSHLKGIFALVRTRMKGSQEHWLLIKKQDTFALSDPYDAEKVKPADFAGTPMEFIPPMLASLVEEVFNDPDYLYEIKWDGYRLQAHVNSGAVELFSRNGQRYEKKFAKLLPELARLPQQVVLDGEVVVVDAKGIPDFEALQQYPEKSAGALQYYVFDLLFLNGHQTTSLPLEKRKELLQEVLLPSALIRYNDHMVGMGTTLYTMAVESGMEGVIAKQRQSLYQPGYRSEAWKKIKGGRALIALICGFTKTESSTYFGSLVLGQQKDGVLQYIGNCGTGFSTKDKKKLYDLLIGLKKDTPPFAAKPNLRGRETIWVAPELEAEVNYSSWTKNGLLRHPVFKELQEKVPRSKAIPAGGPGEVSQADAGEKLDFGEVQVAVSNLEKVLWPEQGYRKYELIDYYLNLSDHILPYLKDRPQNLHRHPDGITSEGFYQKEIDHLPSWMETLLLESSGKKSEIAYVLCQDEASLLYLANLGCIELHTWNSRKGQIDHPDWAVLDLDPSDQNSFDEVVELAQAAHELLNQIGAPSYCKTSGSRGLHIYIPTAGAYSYEEARGFVQLLSYHLKDALPTLATMARKKADRGGKIYLDYLQNRKGQSIVAPYSLRPKPGAPVAAPLQWAEVRKGLRMSDFNLESMPARVGEQGDLFEGVLSDTLDMEQALLALEEL